MLHDFAQQVRLQHETIIEQWMTAVREDDGIPTARQLAEVELRDHLDGVLSKLRQALARAAAVGETEVEPPPEAEVHGVVRSQQHYQVDELVREIGVLRGSFLEFFSAFLKQCRQIGTDEFLQVTQVVHRFFDEICSDSVGAYVRTRDEQAESHAQSLRESNEALEKINHQFEAADAYRRRILRTVAHEMATPVNALGLGVSYLSESLDEIERLEAKTMVRRTMEHLRAMLDQLYDFSRSEGGHERLQVTEFEARPLFAYLVAGFEPIASAKGLEFRATLDPALGALHSDEHKVQRIAANLLSNAIKYCEQGTVTLTLSAVSERDWSIEVSDTGCGIPPEECARVFAEFERLQRHSDQPGLGLGLAIVQTLAERLGGEVTLESEVGKGSTFRVVLPRRI